MDGNSLGNHELGLDSSGYSALGKEYAKMLSKLH